MYKTIEQIISFKDTTPEELFDIFLDAKKHSEILGGAEVKITNQEGDKFTCMDGHITGKNLMIIPNRMIVQSWRGNVWEKDDLDSILVLVFSKTKNEAQIRMMHANTPDQFTELWDRFYWQPMKAYLKKQNKK